MSLMQKISWPVFYIADFRSASYGAMCHASNLHPYVALTRANYICRLIPSHGPNSYRPDSMGGRLVEQW